VYRVSVEEGNIRGCKKNWLRIAGKMEEKLQICGDVSKYAGKRNYRYVELFPNM
jgi:hypothetical protein